MTATSVPQGVDVLADQEPAPDVDRATLFEALDNETARAILVDAAEEPRSARELADRTGTSHTTVYRWLERLEAHGLLEEGLRIDMDGNHHKVYQSAVERLEIDVRADGLAVRVERREGAADRLTRIWEEIRG